MTITVLNHLTLDGVMQGPGRKDEDTRGGFAHGGWAQAGNDEVMGRFMGERMARGGSLLLGRRTSAPPGCGTAFDDGVEGPSMELVDTITTTTGVIIATYRSASNDPS